MHPLLIVVILLAFFGIIVGIIILVKKHFKPLQIDKEEIDEDVAVQQELDRVLVPIEDEETLKQMNEVENKDTNNVEKH